MEVAGETLCHWDMAIKILHSACKASSSVDPGEESTLQTCCPLPARGGWSLLSRHPPASDQHALWLLGLPNACSQRFEVMGNKVLPLPGT